MVGPIQLCIRKKLLDYSYDLELYSFENEA